MEWKRLFFAVLLDTTTYGKYGISIILRIFRWEATVSPIQSSDITPNPTISIPHPSIPAPNQTSVATYSTPLQHQIQYQMVFLKE